MFDILMLPARHGDCLWLEYGEDGGKVFRSLVDCGTGTAWPHLEAQILGLPEDERHFELLVITHVDDDHIGGSLKLLANAKALGVTFGDIWFNSFPHLEGHAVITGPDLLGPVQGEALSDLIAQSGFTWNGHEAFQGRAVVCPDEGDLPVAKLASGLELTLLSPYWEQLDSMKKVWIEKCKEEGLIPGGTVPQDMIDDTLGDEDIDVDALADTPFKSDDAEANGSSIAFLAAFGGRTVLFGADAYAPVVAQSLERLGHSAGNRLALSALKASHHGSKGNTSRELLDLVTAENILVSTSGAKFKHPDRAAIARMVKFREPGAGLKLHFNYRSKFNEFWGAEAVQATHGYQAVFPEDGGEDGVLWVLL